MILVVIDDANRWRQAAVGQELSKRFPNIFEEADKNSPLNLGDCPFIKMAKSPEGHRTWVCLAVARKYVAKTGETNYQARSFETALNAVRTLLFFKRSSSSH